MSEFNGAQAVRLNPKRVPKGSLEGSQTRDASNATEGLSERSSLKPLRHLLAAVCHTGFGSSIRMAFAMLGTIMGPGGRIAGAMLRTALILVIGRAVNGTFMVHSLAGFAMRRAIMLCNRLSDALFHTSGFFLAFLFAAGLLTRITCLGFQFIKATGLRSLGSRCNYGCCSLRRRCGLGLGLFL